MVSVIPRERKKVIKKIALVFVAFMCILHVDSQERETVEFESVGHLYSAIILEGFIDYSVDSTIYELPQNGHDVEFTETHVKKDAILNDSYYGDFMIKDEYLRYMVVVSRQYHVDLIYILSMIAIDNSHIINPCLVDDLDIAFEEIYLRVRWTNRVVALGYPTSNILLAYKENRLDLF